MRIKFLSTDNTIKLVIAGLIFFVLLGDVLLPEPLKSASKNTKSAINSVIIGVLPSKGFDDPHDRTEKAVEELEQRN
ncbi:hypothetical protein Lepto7376_1757 [[Leptolyngbya] sp. PCC 7376]|uniref:hypothetical protein n=1 Tax=[Leptolyngbya] sp. PCC 7376 TaxID=111781 RepID=UPI00029EFB71|nr:hypothetical protein [[Leptolyngbya] sp. PCC 7376]AFY38090.1 hypothetical protein Lepto7376_1757 [[Leptolyngbya] sp. PCC 7376]